VEHKDIVGGLLKSPGVEIGAFTTPIPGIKPIYVDRFSEYANQQTLAEYRGDSADLPFHDSSLEYVATSHVIEHVANPLAAILEWYRVLRDGGIIYMVVPDRRLIFDRTRELTPVDHMIEDFRNSVTQSDPTHIREFSFNVDWTDYSPQTPAHKVPEEREALFTQYSNALAAGGETNIHFHTFEPQTALDLLKRCNETLPLQGGRIDVIRHEAPFPKSRPDGFLIVAKVHKPGPMPVFADTVATLRPDAHKFERRVETWDESNFPEESYLRFNDDVAKAVRAGHHPSGFAHYKIFGHRENRRIK
jgi:hypothetical protein